MQSRVTTYTCQNNGIEIEDLRRSKYANKNADEKDVLISESRVVVFYCEKVGATGLLSAQLWPY